MAIVSWICLGILSGLLSNRILAIPNLYLKAFTYAITITGALAGGYVGIQQGWAWGDITSFNILSFMAAVVGTVVLGGIYLACVVIASRSRNHQKIL
mgnify:CR=1 FL=1|jgi:uncharacterized membrane protein YeaQ/YmgE (transglycosylase-associated protein family)